MKTNALSPKQRMLHAYRGIPVDRPPVAPEFWYYYPAKILGLDMIRFSKEVPFHHALKRAFEAFSCEGWGIVCPVVPNPLVETAGAERWIDDVTLETRTITRTPRGELAYAMRLTRDEPGWCVERPLKDLARDLEAWQATAFGGDPETMDLAKLQRERDEVGGSYLLEASIGVPFFDFWAGAREGGFETGIFDFMDPALEPLLLRLRDRYTDRLVRLVDAIAAGTAYESIFLGCSWSCNSLLGPALWRKWDKPVIRAVAEAVHRHGRLLHIHFHGRSQETAADFTEIGVDCVCPFERPPGGDVGGIEGLRQVRSFLADKVTFNGNVHTVETLIRGRPEDVRREVAEIREAFAGSARLIIGTGDQVGRETPEENLWAMVEEGKRR